MSFNEEKLLELLVGALVDYPNDVHLTRTVDVQGVLLTLRVHKSDMGKVIGRQGTCAQALRTILRAVGMKENMHVNLKILEPMTDGQNTMREALKDVQEATQV